MGGSCHKAYILLAICSTLCNDYIINLGFSCHHTTLIHSFIHIYKKETKHHEDEMVIEKVTHNNKTSCEINLKVITFE